MKDLHGAGTSADDAAQQARSAGARVFVVDPGDTKEQVLEQFAQSLDFPRHFGHNLDALADCLADVVDGSEGGTAIVWRVSPAFRRTRSFVLIKGLLADTEDYSVRPDPAAAPGAEGGAGPRATLQVLLVDD